MADTIEVKVIDTGLQAKIDKVLAAAQAQPMFQVIGSSIANRVRLCFKLGIDPWGNPWTAIKYRAPRMRKRGGFTKAGAAQFAANRAGTPGQPLRDTGRLQRSITTKAGSDSVTVGTNVMYAPTHQFGATIVAKNKPFLVFPGPDGGLIFAKRVRIPQRAFLPIRKPGAPVVLPVAWSALVANALRRYFRKEIAG